MNSTTDGFAVHCMIRARMKIVSEERPFRRMIGPSMRSEDHWSVRYSVFLLNHRSICVPFAMPNASYRRGRRSTRYQSIPRQRRSFTVIGVRLHNDHDLGRPMAVRMPTMKSHPTDRRDRIF